MTFTWDIERVASEANNDFILTHEELLAIFTAHVPTSSAHYAEIRQAFEDQLDTLDLDAIGRSFKQQVEDGARSLTLDIPVSITLGDVVTDVPVTITTNIDLQVNEGGSVTSYVIDHQVNINGQIVQNNSQAITSRLDEVTGTVSCWWDNTQDPVTNPTGDSAEMTHRGGGVIDAKLIDDTTDPRITDRNYQLWVITADQEVENGDGFNALNSRTPTGFNLGVNTANTGRISNPQAVNALNSDDAYVGLAVLDFGTQTVLVTDAI